DCSVCYMFFHLRLESSVVMVTISDGLELSVFFSKPDDDHRDLHSFPTRRSSDLWRSRDRRRPNRRAAVRRRGRWSAPGRVAADRSEEHTSELQSRFDLVCRLLLEKKNTPVDCHRSD